MIRTLFLILLALSLHVTVSAIQNRILTRKFGNVYVRTIVGERNKPEDPLRIAGILASRLCDLYEYSAPIYIDLTYACENNCANVYLLAFDNGTITRYGQTTSRRGNKKALSIYAVYARFDMRALLNVLEYGLKNTGPIAKGQQVVECQYGYSQFSSNSIDTGFLRSLAGAEPSQVVKNVLATEVYRRELPENPVSVSTYFQDNKFHVYTNESCLPDSPILSLNNTWRFERLSSYDALVFDTDSYFYYVSSVSQRQVSSRHVLHPILTWGFAPTIDIKREFKDPVVFMYSNISPNHTIGQVTVNYFPSVDTLRQIESPRRH
ncbi:MAG: hypothetical protein KF744_13360 [Taibaiella sp.]|nr:hypothetical protein [Taibaiella sp.]